MSRKIVILGAAGFAREAQAWIEGSSDYRVEAYCAPEAPDVPTPRPVVDKLDDFRGLHFLVAVGEPRLRMRLWEEGLRAGLLPCDPVIHPSAVVGERNSIGKGTILCPGAILTVDAEIGQNVLINIGATIGHDAKVGDHANIAPGVSISGFCVLERGAYIGTRAALREHVRIGEWATVGLGTSVVKDVAAGITVIGFGQRTLGS